MAHQVYCLQVAGAFASPATLCRAASVIQQISNTQQHEFLARLRSKLIFAGHLYYPNYLQHTMSNGTFEPYSNIITGKVVPYTIVAFAALLVYEILICLSDEITLVWSRASNPRTWIYIMNRYLPLIDTFLSARLLTSIQPPEVCARDFKIVTWMIVVGIILAEGILMQRTYAIFERRKWMFVFLCCLMATLAIPCIVVVHLELNTVHYGFARPNKQYVGCMLTGNTSVIIVVAYVLILLSETVIFALTLYKAVQDLRFCRSPLIVNLYRNGLVYYAYVLAVSLANVIVPIVGPGDLANWLATPQRVLHSIFCARILLSILRDGNLNTQDISLLSGSSIIFRAPFASEMSVTWKPLEHLVTSGNVATEGPYRSAGPRNRGEEPYDTRIAMDSTGSNQICAD